MDFKPAVNGRILHEFLIVFIGGRGPHFDRPVGGIVEVAPGNEGLFFKGGRGGIGCHAGFEVNLCKGTARVRGGIGNGGSIVFGDDNKAMRDVV